MNKAISWGLCVAWMAFIFIMSATPGEVSGKQSGAVVEVVIHTARVLAGEEAASRIDTDLLHHLIRKAAHMAEYAVLCMLYCHALRLSGARHPVCMALLMSAAYAATDEFHQSFTDGRGPSPVDVLIDTAGAGIGCALQACAVSLWRRLRRTCP